MGRYKKIKRMYIKKADGSLAPIRHLKRIVNTALAYSGSSSNAVNVNYDGNYLNFFDISHLQGDIFVGFINTARRYDKVFTFKVNADDTISIIDTFTYDSGSTRNYYYEGLLMTLSNSEIIARSAATSGGSSCYVNAHYLSINAGGDITVKSSFRQYTATAKQRDEWYFQISSTKAVIWSLSTNDDKFAMELHDVSSGSLVITSASYVASDTAIFGWYQDNEMIQDPTDPYHFFLYDLDYNITMDMIDVTITSSTSFSVNATVRQALSVDSSLIEDTDQGFYYLDFFKLDDYHYLMHCNNWGFVWVMVELNSDGTLTFIESIGGDWCTGDEWMDRWNFTYVDGILTFTFGTITFWNADGEDVDDNVRTHIVNYRVEADYTLTLIDRKSVESRMDGYGDGYTYFRYKGVCNSPDYYYFSINCTYGEAGPIDLNVYKYLLGETKVYEYIQKSQIDIGVPGDIVNMPLATDFTEVSKGGTWLTTDDVGVDYMFADNNLIILEGIQIEWEEGYETPAMWEGVGALAHSAIEFDVCFLSGPNSSYEPLFNIWLATPGDMSELSFDIEYYYGTWSLQFGSFQRSRDDYIDEDIVFNPPVDSQWYKVRIEFGAANASFYFDDQLIHRTRDLNIPPVLAGQIGNYEMDFGYYGSRIKNYRHYK